MPTSNLYKKRLNVEQVLELFQAARIPAQQRASDVVAGRQKQSIMVNGEEVLEAHGRITNPAQFDRLAVTRTLQQLQKQRSLSSARMSATA